jgi:cytochrome c oxidase subunit 4
MSSHPAGDVKTYYIVFAILIALVFATIVAAGIEHDLTNVILAIVIAVTKAALIIWFFMHVQHATVMTKLIIASGLLWAAFLFVLTLNDYTTRNWSLNTGQPGASISDR